MGIMAPEVIFSLVSLCLDFFLSFSFSINDLTVFFFHGFQIILAFGTPISLSLVNTIY